MGGIFFLVFIGGLMVLILGFFVGVVEVFMVGVVVGVDILIVVGVVGFLVLIIFVVVNRNKMIINLNFGYWFIYYYDCYIMR